MKSHHFQVLLILFLLGGMLLCYSYFQPSLPSVLIKNEPVFLKFIPFEKMFVFGPKRTNSNVDSLLVKYEAAAKETPKLQLKEHIRQNLPWIPDSLFYSYDSLENPYFINPEAGGITALDSFFTALHEESRTQLVRIAHFGDSKTEGDRISSVLRRKFISIFGGKGVGYIPMDDITTCVSYTRIPTRNWYRYSVMFNKYKQGTFGLSGVVFHYKEVGIIPRKISEAGDTTKPVSVYYGNKASVTFRLYNSYDHLKVLFGNTPEPCQVMVYDTKTDQCIGLDTLIGQEDFQIRNIPLTKNCLNLKVEFQGPSPDIYGLSLDGDNGVQVDNYGLRGHSGNQLLSIRSALFSKQVSQTHTHLIILQYGGNAVPGKKSEKELEYLEDNFYHLYAGIKKRAPDASVLVVSVGDMGTQVEGQKVSYSMVGKVRDAQKSAALRANCAFFDLYEMMGGENSILAWVNKGYASLDGHYTPKGEIIAGNQIFQAIIQQYSLYLKKLNLRT